MTHGKKKMNALLVNKNLCEGKGPAFRSLKKNHNEPVNDATSDVIQSLR